MVEATQEISKFLSALYGESQGHVDIVTKSESGQLDSERFFEWPTERNRVEKYIGLRSDEDTYLSVALFSNEHRTKDDHGAVARVVYADADTCPPEKFRLPPSISVQTSEGRWHCYWVLDEEVPAKDASEAAHRIAKAHEKQGCDISGWIVSKVLRAPGTSNTKSTNPFTVTAEFNDQVYTLDTINDVYADVDISPTVILDTAAPKPVSKAKRLELEQRLDAAGLSSLYLEKPMEGQSWSERLFRLELELFRLGMTPQEVFSLVQEASCNKYNPDFAGERTQTGILIPKRRDPEGALWKDVQKAFAEYQTEAEVEVEETLVGGSTPKHAEFLSTDERRWVMDNSTFVDEYTAWVASKSDSAETYQRSLAWLLLSAVFGDKGYIPIKWERTGLNLWVLLLGDTTSTRKTTAKRLFMKALHLYEQETGEKLDIGNDTTAEALIKELGQRNGKVSFLHRDEIHGLFAEQFAKTHMVGLLETLTDLYDGLVPVVLRSTKDTGNRNRATTVFNFLGVGVRERVSHVLTKDYFRSGFLARMLWSVADPPPRKPGSEDIAFEDPDDASTQYDSVLDSLVDDLVRRGRGWSKDKPTPIWMDEGTINRYNKWAEGAMQFAEKYGDGEILVPSFQRMKATVAKAAALMAMYDQTDTISMRHLLPALSQAELWFNDMVRMASEISSSDFERRLNDIEAFIASGEDRQRIESSVRRKFAKLRPREFEEVLTALLTQGRIKRLTGKDKQRLQAL